MSDTIKILSEKARFVRRNTLEMIVAANKGHIGGAFSCIDILTILYYAPFLRFDVTNARWFERDRFILSKGHCCEALYVILADLGFISKSELGCYQKGGGILAGHPDRRVPGIEADTGSLGHGLGIACGMALRAKLDGLPFFTLALLGDGECCEGSVWEAALFAAHRGLGHLIGIVDANGVCSTDILADCSSVEPLTAKWRAFGWDVIEVDGHNIVDLLTIFESLKARDMNNRPLMIIARTVKGKGVSFMEGSPSWHHGVPKGAQLDGARQELGETLLIV
ncbi:MAG: transketolase [Candidatus Omnitrophica bacterium]|nr:transketolase [Candidatus Omnitrophota bacterium]